MKLGQWICLAPLVLIGCAPITTFYKPGVSATRLEADSVQCSVSALRQVPVANKVVQDPPRFVPARTICNKDGRCRTHPGRFIPGAIRTVDSNAPLRVRVTRQCMAARGYSVQQIPQCTGSSAQSVQVSPLPALSANSCAVRDANGTLGIGTQK